jgi:hypothetical protein
MTLLLAVSLVAGVSAGNASKYGYAGDAYDRVGSFACQRRLESRYGARIWEKMRDHGVAHRTLPCGTSLGVCLTRTGQCTTAYVVDRGPWGTLNRNGEWHQRTGRLLPGEYFRGELDLLPGTYTAIGLQGIEKVHYWAIGEGLSEPPGHQHPRRADYPLLRAADPGHTPAYPPLRQGDGHRPATTTPLLAQSGRALPFTAAPVLLTAATARGVTATPPTATAIITATADPSSALTMAASPQRLKAQLASSYPLLRLAGHATHSSLPLRLVVSDPLAPKPAEPKLSELPLLASGPR